MATISFLERSSNKVFDDLPVNALFVTQADKEDLLLKVSSEEFIVLRLQDDCEDYARLSLHDHQPFCTEYESVIQVKLISAEVMAL